MKPLFETSQTGYRTSVYPDYVAYKLFLSGEKTIAINHIVSVEASRFLGQVTIETTAGKRIKIPVKANDQNKLRDAIYQVKREFGQVKQNQRGSQEKPLLESPEQVVLEKPSKKKSNSILAKKSNSILAICLIILVILMFKDAFTSNPKPSSPSFQSNPTESEAHIIAKDFIKASLKSPLTAKFPFLEYNSVALPDTEFGKNRYRASSYVDAQNAFGAMIRNNWTVTLRYLGGEWSLIENWELEELILDGEVIYTIY